MPNYPFNSYLNQNQTPQVSFMSIRGKDIAANYPIAPGNTIFFKDELAPYIYVKTMGFSPLDHPTFEQYKREDVVLPQETVSNVSNDNSSIEKIQSDIRAIMDELDGIKKKLNTRAVIKKKELEDE